MSDPRFDDTRELYPTRQMPPAAPPPGKRKRRGESPLAIPLWALALMLLLVLGITAGVVSLVVLLGGQTTPGGEPRVIIVTAPPTPTPDQPPTAPPDAIAAPTDAPAVPVFALEGPTLVPIYLSPTPRIITIGSPVLVNIDGLNVRPSPGISNTPVFNAALGSGFNVIDGPVQADGLTWWLIQDPGSAGRRGWAAAIYLDVFAPPTP